MYIGLCIAVFLVAYLANTITITVFYHRGFAHRAITMKPWLERFAIRYGNWLTGLDPKGWVCMHRLHHAHSDQRKDPHSPVHAGFFRLVITQLKAYKKILVGIHKKIDPYHSIVSDLEFDISWLNKKRVWWLPYAVHFAIGAVLALAFGWWLLGAAYFFGIMSHPLEGWAVNAFGHAIGGRNFDTPDNSRNNNVVAWLIMGEGYQNNHHRFPASAKFSYRWWEIDPGYAICRMMAAMGMITIDEKKLIPSPRRLEEEPAPAE